MDDLHFVREMNRIENSLGITFPEVQVKEWQKIFARVTDEEFTIGVNYLIVNCKGKAYPAWICEGIEKHRAKANDDFLGVQL